MTIQSAIEQLQNYKGPTGLSLHPGADDTMLQAVENTYNITLPDDFKEFYRFADGFETDEDIFNMIPLKYIIENKHRKGGAAFYIAEYMIYSDMWQLEINPNNCNDYKIIIWANYNKLVLTNSLGEFISRFLKGGVFGTGGLYEWQDEVELQPIYTTKLKTAEFLLTAFYHGIKYGLVSTTEVKDWADRIILHEDEPEYIFMELSLSHDKNEMLSLLTTVCVPANYITARGVLGLLYHRLSAGDITANEAIAIMDKFDFIDLLTQTEINYIYDFTDGIWMNDPIVENENSLTENLLNFLAHYKELEIANYKNWLVFSNQIKYKFTKKEDELNGIDQLALHKRELYLSRQWVFILATIYILALVSFIVVITTYTYVADKTPLSKFRTDLYRLSALYLTCFILYCILRGILWLLAKLQKVVK
jgi:hypothetical protein